MSTTAENMVFRSSVSSVNQPTIEESGISDAEGYDYEFVPSLDNKYMCPICLMALKNAVQTTCGHRFCRSCIKRSLVLQRRCPVDNEALNEELVFPDNYARREILDLIAKCRNKGCHHNCELRKMEEHSKVCPMRKVPCKHNCGLILLVDDAIFHEDNQCPKRPVKCDKCGNMYPFDHENSHNQECLQHQTVTCPYCKHEMKQYKLQQHVTLECSQAPIKCVFEKVGCPQEHSRHNMQHHMEKSTQIHLQYLLNNVRQIMKSNSDFTELVEALNTRVQALESNDSSFDTNDDNINIYERDTHGMANGYGNMPKPGIQATSTRNVLASSRSSFGDDGIDEIQRIKENNLRMEMNRASASVRSENRPESVVSVLDKDVEEKLIGLDHHVRELMAKMDTQIVSVKDLATRLSSVEQKMSHQELRCCNGLYFWKIKEYSRFRKAASTGEINVLHSPGFYTSPQGYKICIRVNLDGVENYQGTHLSLFVHLMKGENDDLLAWPFAGVITLTVINQKDQPHERSHISETLHAQTNLMAFQRPMSERNQKGYGYIDFFPLQMLESQGFIKNDTLIIKAHVRVDAPQIYQSP